MKMLQVIIRPERLMDVVRGLDKVGISALTRLSILGRGKQRGLQIGEIIYDELPKEMLIIVLDESMVQTAINTVLSFAKTGLYGTNGDGKIFISDICTEITISTGEISV